MFQYQQHKQYFAQIASGFEEIAKAELERLGATNIIEAYRGLHFEASHEVLYRINYTARLIVRVLAPLVTFDCHSDNYLHQTALKQDWSQFMTVNDTFAVHAVTSNTPSLTHSQYAALKVKDAICDFFRNKEGGRPNVDIQNPDLGIHLFIRNSRATLSIDVSGGSLHRRGYRTVSVEAPMQETLGAAIIHLSGWDGERPLIDPMCGSGTLLCEAAMSYCRIPAGYLRKSQWGFERLPDFDSKVWKKVKAEADSLMRPLPAGLLSGSDINRDAVRATRANLNNLPGCKDRFQCSEKDVFSFPSIGNSTIVVNPPYGVRLGDRESAEKLMKEFGDFLKQRCTGCTAFVYAGDRQLLKKVGLKPEWKQELNNGGLEGILGKIDLYASPKIEKSAEI
ncbi:MAG: class I SAM-dependent RNA methyltransferase [Verrucomicrobia bacterium]|nr:class I SAM-dependent RNA methyltransferase [Verrucomicrobiota bacterium]